VRIVNGRADARWLPSRFNYALFRLVAYVRMRTIRPEWRDVSLMIDRNQNNLESHLIGAWTTLTLTCYAVGTIFRSWPVALAIPAGVVVAITCLEIPIIVMGVLLRKRENIGLNSVVMMTLLIAAALYFARAQHVQAWVRFAGWQFLGGIALNALAAPAAFLLRGSIADMEKAAGGITSEL
jgi:hypothetical protein